MSIPWRRPSTPVLPLDLFERALSEREVKVEHKLERIYHLGQVRGWDGRAVLRELVDKHGGVRLPTDRREAVRQLFAVILWGELAAWKVSADLALQIDDLGAKMAATSQAHDEACHFYVMRDYLKLTGDVPRRLGPATEATLRDVLEADTLLKKLLGMQLMIEPMALTIFQLAREYQIEPLLCDLLPYFERDEARHVALGVLQLPTMLSHASMPEAIDLWAWQISAYMGQLRTVRELAPTFEALGINPRDVLRLGREKQIVAAQMLGDQMGVELPVWDTLRRVMDFRIELDFPTAGGGPRRDPASVARALKVALRRRERVDATLSTVSDAA